MSTFSISLTADFRQDDGSPRYADIGLDVLEREPAIDYAYFDEHRGEIGSDQLAGANGAIVLTPKITAESLAAAEDLLAIGRFGVGFDSVDVAACTANDVCLFITAGAVDRSVAEATVMWMLALGHHLRTKDDLVRAGEWDARSAYMGQEVRDRRLGLIGCGGIGKSVIELLSGWGMQAPMIYDPFLDEARAQDMGAELADLDTLLASCDYVSIHCPLTEDTKGLIGREQLARMRDDAFLINTARGGIVDEDALSEALTNGGIKGAAIDCFETEPVTDPPPFVGLPNVLCAPHSIAWTNELFRDIGRAACQGMVDLAHGRKPRGVINPEVFDSPGFQAKWQRLTGKEVLA